ncbi:hypothetical protein F2Q70_00003691 [Brassica cretica]|uniref:Uncharacterized protein n=1 Tax=Brassica cretica TaxID=69181 RepID=A0A8S9IYN8_BRACR|nr:hypothetical protein F2Q70_00003691 [Brassica cretica]
MEDMEFGRISIDEMTKTSSEKSILELINADTPPEAGKFPLTNDANKGVVLGEPKGKLSNAINQIINKLETEIPVKIKLISKRDHETKLPLQDYLNPCRTYSNRLYLGSIDHLMQGFSDKYLELQAYADSSFSSSCIDSISIDVAGCGSFLRMVSKSCCSRSILVLNQSTLLLRGL